ncbi:MAG TPA: hypothetical protein PLU37_00380 [Chitinophagaceae bacterium]|nr:hypothetical protein [Chitinophagaceae bacterium]MCB9055087.1 hypothetical protein [Chitinophagales bacterium]HPG09954.1 hypothetical protein [Chitinophagaceae bacterium]HRX93113.1 hypothetical protein [Chitinophagaceae bacterium]
MGKKDTKELLKFLKPFSKERAELLLWLRDFAWGLCPQANEIIYDNFNAVAIGWTPTEKLGHTICSIAIYRSNENIHFGFYWGNQIKDPEKMLLGQGNQYRYIQAKDKKSFPKTYIKQLVGEAYANSLAKVKDPKQLVQGLTIVKSVSANKRPAAKSKKK